MRQITAVSLLIAFLAGAGTVAPAEPGSIALLVTYKCQPASRPALRAYLEGPGSRQLAEWQREKKFADSLLLFGLDVNDELWDALLLLRFEGWPQYGSWKETEQAFPAGLAPSALELTTSVSSTLAELAWQGSAPADKRPATKPVYFVRPYYFDDPGAYRRFFEAYNRPQFQAWIREGALSRYWGLMNQNPSGRAWGVQLIYEYPGWEAASGGRDAVKSALAAELNQNPAWDLLGQIKGQIRSSGRVTLAEAIVPHAR